MIRLPCGSPNSKSGIITGGLVPKLFPNLWGEANEDKVGLANRIQKMLEDANIQLASGVFPQWICMAA
jgi:hypothetical protein